MQGTLTDEFLFFNDTSSTDINDQKQFEQKLKEAHDAAQKSTESKTRFLSNMSHGNPSTEHIAFCLTWLCFHVLIHFLFFTNSRNPYAAHRHYGHGQLYA